MAETKVTNIGTGPVEQIYPGMDPAVDVTTHRVYSQEEMDVDVGLRKDMIADSAKILNTLDDVFERGMSDVHLHYANESVSLPESMSMKLMSGGANVSATFPVLDPLLGGVLAGTATDLTGKELGQRMRYFQAYYNEMKAGVVVEQYGVEFNKIDPFGVYSKATNQLAKLYSETKGRARRECLTQWYNKELMEPGSGVAGIGQYYNPNWFIANSTTPDAGKVDGYGMPIYTSTIENFEVNIATAIKAAATGTNGADANLSLNALDRISFLANEKMIEKIDGKYCIVVPMPQWYKITNLNFDGGGFGQAWTAVADYGKDTISYPGEVGTYRDLRIIADERWASLVVTDMTLLADPTFTFEYVEPGGMAGDAREKSPFVGGDTANMQIGWLLGKAAFIERMEKDLFYREVEQEYKKRKGIGGFMEAGWNLTVIRTDTQTAGYPDYAENRNSAVLAFSSAII
jgi:hypothetical protein